MKIGSAPERASSIGALAERANPALDLVVVFGVRRRRAVGDERRVAPVAVILDGESELLEQAADAGGAQRRRSHQRAGLRRADLDGHAEQGDARFVDSAFGHQRGSFKEPNKGDAVRSYALK